MLQAAGGGGVWSERYNGRRSDPAAWKSSSRTQDVRHLSSETAPELQPPACREELFSGPAMDKLADLVPEQGEVKVVLDGCGVRGCAQGQAGAEAQTGAQG
jgi:hypothetical protein